MNSRKGAGEQGNRRAETRPTSVPLHSRTPALPHLRPWVMLLVLLIAATLRLYGLNNLSPPGLAHDEVAHWLINRSILAGNHAVYFTEAYGHEAGFHYVQTLFTVLLGDHALALRLPAAFAGLLVIAISYVLARHLFGANVALAAAALLAVLLWPVFYSRLGLRAISLPLLSGLSACFWWRAWEAEERRSGRAEENGTRPPAFLLAGLFAGLSLHTYMAARAVPLFYALFVLYLALFHRPALKERWRGVFIFWLVLTAVAAPLAIYLITNPGAEFRISEVDAPLQALQAGNVQPVLMNTLRIAAAFGFAGDPLWRQNVAGMPIFDPVVAALFYLGIALCLWHFRDKRHAFLLLWLVTAASPSIVTIDAPSTIRMINALPVLTIFPALLIHSWRDLSTVFNNLSTGVGKFCLAFVLVLFLYHTGRTTNAIFHIWPRNDEVRFVWQAALTQAAGYLDASLQNDPIAVAGWSPDTMDPPTMALTLRRADLPLSYFNPQEQALLIPAADSADTHLIVRPTILELDPAWEAQLSTWGAMPAHFQGFTLYTLLAPLAIQPQVAANVTFGEELHLLGYDIDDCCDLVTYWQVIRIPGSPRRLFVHFLDEHGNLVAEAYAFDTADPQSLWFPHWRPGDLILQRSALPAAAKEVAQVRLGWFDPYTCQSGSCQNLLTESGEAYVLIGAAADE